MRPDVIAALTDKDDKSACAFAEKIVTESRETRVWYGCFEEFSSLLDHPKSYVRNRVLAILAANARWDDENRFDALCDSYLSHITDEKPITARQCVQSLAEVGKAKPSLVPKIQTALQNADLSRYKESMRPLLEKDIRETLKILSDPAFLK